MRSSVRLALVSILFGVGAACVDRSSEPPSPTEQAVSSPAVPAPRFELRFLADGGLLLDGTAVTEERLLRILDRAGSSGTVRMTAERDVIFGRVKRIGDRIERAGHPVTFTWPSEEGR